MDVPEIFLNKKPFQVETKIQVIMNLNQFFFIILCLIYLPLKSQELDGIKVSQIPAGTILEFKEDVIVPANETEITLDHGYILILNPSSERRIIRKERKFVVASVNTFTSDTKLRGDKGFGNTMLTIDLENVKYYYQRILFNNPNIRWLEIYEGLTGTANGMLSTKKGKIKDFRKSYSLGDLNRLDMLDIFLPTIKDF